MKLRKFSLIFLAWNSILVLIVAALVVAPSWQRRGTNALSTLATTVSAAEANPWTLAVEKVKEDRGEPVGKQAKIEIPAQLRHYSDTRRFLAIQVAEVKQHHVATPRDMVDLAGMISRGELVQLQPFSDNYILFGVGGSADREPFTRYENGKSIPLYNEAALQLEYKRLADAQSKTTNEIAGLKKQLAGLKKRDRAQRARLQKELTPLEVALKANREDKALLDRYYGAAETRQRLLSDYQMLERVGQEFITRGSKTFDVTDARQRQQMKVSLLSSLRPEAFRVLEEIAASYHEKFGRTLPVTSLVRPDEYQHELSKTNPNATRIETPPHSTGLAFDILYRYMTLAEQTHVMSHLAQLKDEGRIEVLRENRDHYHVFAFVDGARPGEQFVAAALLRSGASKSSELRKEAVAQDKSKQSRRVSVSHHASKKAASAKPKVVKAKRKSRR